MLRKGETIWVADQFRKTNKGEWKYSFSTSRKDMIRILEEWYELLVTDPLPDRVHIVEDNGMVRFIPEFLDMPEMESVPVIVLKK